MVIWYDKGRNKAREYVLICFYFLVTALLRHNSPTIWLTHLKSSIQWFSVYSQGYANSSTINFINSHLPLLFPLSLSSSAAAAAKSLQSCPTLCDPTDGSPPGSPVPGILQARILKWVAISFSSAWKWKVKGKSFSRVRPSVTPWTPARLLHPWDFPGKSTGVGCHKPTFCIYGFLWICLFWTCYIHEIM